MWSARKRPARVSGPAPRTNDIDTDERRQIIPQRGRPTTNHQQGVDKRCLMALPSFIKGSPSAERWRCSSREDRRETGGPEGGVLGRPDARNGVVPGGPSISTGWRLRVRIG